MRATVVDIRAGHYERKLKHLENQKAALELVKKVRHDLAERQSARQHDARAGAAPGAVEISVVHVLAAVGEAQLHHVADELWTYVSLETV